MEPERTPEPAPKKLTLKKETLRRLTRSDLRLAVGGGMALPTQSCRCYTVQCWTWHCPPRTL
jgi:hypothetical protein